MRRLFLAALLLAGCNQIQDAADAALPKYRGKPVDLVFQKWGTPDRRIPGDGGTIFQWKVQGGGSECRMEVHAGRNGGGGPETVMGIRATGGEQLCANYLRML